MSEQYGEESSLEAAADQETAADLAATAPGAGGPVGSGVEGADDILAEDYDRDAEEWSEDAPDYPADLGEDESSAAEQGNRDADEMVAEGEDAREDVELGGDTLDVDALGGVEPEPLGGAADLEGDVDGEDPLAGEGR